MSHSLTPVFDHISLYFSSGGKPERLPLCLQPCWQRSISRFWVPGLKHERHVGWGKKISETLQSFNFSIVVFRLSFSLLFLFRVRTTHLMLLFELEWNHVSSVNSQPFLLFPSSARMEPRPTWSTRGWASSTHLLREQATGPAIPSADLLLLE